MRSALTAEFGLVAPIGRKGLQNLIKLFKTSDARVPEEASACLQLLAIQLKLMNSPILATDRRVLPNSIDSDNITRLPGAVGR
jgi:transposase